MYPDVSTKVRQSRNIRCILQPLAFNTIFQQFCHCATQFGQTFQQSLLKHFWQNLTDVSRRIDKSSAVKKYKMYLATASIRHNFPTIPTLFLDFSKQQKRKISAKTAPPIRKIGTADFEFLPRIPLNSAENSALKDQSSQKVKNNTGSLTRFFSSDRRFSTQGRQIFQC